MVFRDLEWRALIEQLRLSPREGDILRRIFDDLSEATIACELGLAPSTVHTYVRRLYRKLGVKSRTELLVFVFHEFLGSREPPQRLGVFDPVVARPDDT